MTRKSGERMVDEQTSISALKDLGTCKFELLYTVATDMGFSEDVSISNLQGLAQYQSDLTKRRQQGSIRESVCLGVNSYSDLSVARSLVDYLSTYDGGFVKLNFAGPRLFAAGMFTQYWDGENGDVLRQFDKPIPFCYIAKLRKTNIVDQLVEKSYSLSSRNTELGLAKTAILSLADTLLQRLFGRFGYSSKVWKLPVSDKDFSVVGQEIDWLLENFKK